MQVRGISSIEFHKVLQEARKYCILKTNIGNQAKTKVKQITKELQLRGDCLNKEERKKKKVFYEKLQYNYNTVAILLKWCRIYLYIACGSAMGNNYKTSGPKTSSVLLSIIMLPSITMFFQKLSQTSFLIAFSMSFC